MVACRLPWKTRQKRDRATGGSLALPRVVEVLCPRSQALLAPGQALSRHNETVAAAVLRGIGRTVSRRHQGAAVRAPRGHVGRAAEAHCDDLGRHSKRWHPLVC